MAHCRIFAQIKVRWANECHSDYTEEHVGYTRWLMEIKVFFENTIKPSDMLWYGDWIIVFQQLCWNHQQDKITENGVNDKGINRQQNQKEKRQGKKTSKNNETYRKWDLVEIPTPVTHGCNALTCVTFFPQIRTHYVGKGTLGVKVATYHKDICSVCCSIGV